MEREGLEYASIAGMLAVAAMYVGVRREMCFGWDEAMYGCIVRSLSSSLWNFTICGVPALHKPPLYPYAGLMLSRILGVSWGLRAVASVSGILTAVVSYAICLEVYGDRRSGLICALLTAANPLMWYFSTRCLSDSMGALTFAAVALMSIKSAKSSRAVDLMTLGLLLGLAAEARYPNAIAAVLPAAAFLSHRIKLREWSRVIGYVSVGILAATAPFIALNLKLYNHPFKGPYFASRLIRLDVPVSSLKAAVWLAIYANLLLPAAVYKLMREKPSSNEMLLVVWALLVIIVVFRLPHKEERFFMPAIPPLSILASRCMAKPRERTLIPLVLLLNVAGFSWLYVRTADMGCVEKEAGLYVAKHPKPGIVVSELVPQISFYSGKLVVRFPPSASELRNLAAEGKIGYVVLSTGRNRSPEYAWRMLREGMMTQVFVAESKGMTVIVAEFPSEVRESGS